MKIFLTIVVSFVLGAALIIGIYKLKPGFFEHGGAIATTTEDTEPAVLYWVAPMDDSYRRDEPGLSPMGMKLLPVYKQKASGDIENALYIRPNVENNIGVRIEAAITGALNPIIQTVGFVSYDEDNIVHIHPRIKGWVETLNVKSSGDKVKRGEPLYSLYSPELVNAQDEFLLALNNNNKRLIRGAKSRLKALRISDAFINQLKRTRRVKQTVTFYSMQNGVIENLNIRQGFYVEPGTTLMSIANLDEVWVEAEIFESQAKFVKVGQQASVTLDYLPNKIWQSKVDYIYPTVNAENRSVSIRIRLNNKERLFKPNMFSNVSIHISNNEQQVLVPKEAVIRTGHDDRVIIALGDGQYQAREVILGSADNQYYSIIEGVKVGENVVTSAQFLIDSESNKTSAFKRIEKRDDVPTNKHNMKDKAVMQEDAEITP